MLYKRPGTLYRFWTVTKCQSVARLRRFQPLDAVQQSLAGKSEDTSRPALVPFALLQDVEDVGVLHLPQRPAWAASEGAAPAIAALLHPFR